jgi:hypothetical protein
MRLYGSARPGAVAPSGLRNGSVPRREPLTGHAQAHAAHRRRLPMYLRESRLPVERLLNLQIENRSLCPRTLLNNVGRFCLAPFAAAARDDTDRIEFALQAPARERVR